MNETLKEAKEYLKENHEKGTQCPCCGQHVQLYRYPLFATSAVALTDLYKITLETKSEYHHISKFAEARKGKSRAPHFAELRFWEFIEAKDTKTKDTNTSGLWNVTNKGIQFIKNLILVPKYIHIYNNRFYRFSGEKIDIKKAFGNKFNYNEIMNLLPINQF